MQFYDKDDGGRRSGGGQVKTRASIALLGRQVFPKAQPKVLNISPRSAYMLVERCLSTIEESLVIEHFKFQTCNPIVKLSHG